MSDSVKTLIRDLRLRRGRERRGLALAEGVRLVEEALATGVRIRAAATSPTLESSERGKALKAALRRALPDAACLDVSDRELAELADTERPQGVVAVVEPPRARLADLRTGPGGAVLVLDGVQDPGNVGTMIRTALGLGAAGVIALKGTAELTNPKVLRGTMGAAFRLPVIATDDDGFLAWCAEARATIWVADMRGHAPAGRPADRPVALVVGNEGAGVRAPLRTRADALVAIPLAPGAESLNVAVAAGILLHEVLRER